LVCGKSLLLVVNVIADGPPVTAPSGTLKPLEPSGMQVPDADVPVIVPD
jgi:hypothetical protein